MAWRGVDVLAPGRAATTSCEQRIAGFNNGARNVGSRALPLLRISLERCRKTPLSVKSSFAQHISMAWRA